MWRVELASKKYQVEVELEDTSPVTATYTCAKPRSIR
jgi:hypothetical protein